MNNKPFTSKEFLQKKKIVITSWVCRKQADKHKPRMNGFFVSGEIETPIIIEKSGNEYGVIVTQYRR